VLGALFKTRSRQADKTNLMVFIRPKILRDGFATAIETNTKYNYIREEQRATMRPKTEVLPLLPFSAEPLLPPIPAPLPDANPPPAKPMNPDGSSPEVPPSSPPPAPTGEGAPPKP